MKIDVNSALGARIRELTRTLAGEMRKVFDGLDDPPPFVWVFVGDVAVAIGDEQDRVAIVSSFRATSSGLDAVDVKRLHAASAEHLRQMLLADEGDDAPN